MPPSAYEYDYTREKLPDGQWDINNPNRVDAEGHQIKLITEVIAAIEIEVSMLCAGPSCKLVSPTEWTSEQEDTVATVVANHKANT